VRHRTTKETPVPEPTTPDNTPQQPAGNPGEQQAETAPLGAGSGNRWEPAAQDATATPPATPLTAPPVGPPPAAPPTAQAGAPVPGSEPPTQRRFPRPGRTALTAGIAAAALVLVGAGGFVAGRASVDDHRNGFQVDQEWRRDGQFPGAPGQGIPGQGIPGQGTAPGEGTVPGAPGDLDGDGYAPGDQGDDSSNG